MLACLFKQAAFSSLHTFVVHSIESRSAVSEPDNPVDPNILDVSIRALFIVVPLFFQRSHMWHDMRLFKIYSNIGPILHHITSGPVRISRDDRRSGRGLALRVQKFRNSYRARFSNFIVLTCSRTDQRYRSHLLVSPRVSFNYTHKNVLVGFIRRWTTPVIKSALLSCRTDQNINVWCWSTKTNILGLFIWIWILRNLP